jgi:enoyl-CoA hydratase/carnithine racemase
MIAAVNGSAYGGGVEMILNCDIVIASEDAVFALPEVKRGVLAAQGGERTPHQFILFPTSASKSSLDYFGKLKRGAGIAYV